MLADRYRVERVLGTGGMGMVVAALDAKSGETVAVKIMMPRSAEANVANLVARFAREAAAASRLRSDHVARVTDTGTLPSGAPFLVMEYLRGCDLGSHLKRRGRLPVAMAIDVVLQACDAIAEAHTFGIIHRDLKPANLFLTMRPDGSALVKVLDFGISKSAPSEDTLSSTELVLTGTLTVVGSPHYMAPEQMLSARNVDERADLYALGVNLYLFISGIHPFQAQTLPELCALVLKEPPRPLWEVAPELPDGLDAVVMKCLEKDPADRYPTVAALVRALAPFAATRPPDLTEIVRLPEGFTDGDGDGDDDGDDASSAAESSAAESSAAELSAADLLDVERDVADDDSTLRPQRPEQAATLGSARAQSTMIINPRLRRPRMLAVVALGALLGALLFALILGRNRGRLPPPVVATPPSPPAVVAAQPPPSPTPGESALTAATAPTPPAKVEPARTKRKSTAKARTEEDLLRKRR